MNDLRFHPCVHIFSPDCSSGKVGCHHLSVERCVQCPTFEGCSTFIYLFIYLITQIKDVRSTFNLSVQMRNTEGANQCHSGDFPIVNWADQPLWTESLNQSMSKLVHRAKCIFTKKKQHIRLFKINVAFWTLQQYGQGLTYLLFCLLQYDWLICN